MNVYVCMYVCIFYLGDKSFIWGLSLLFMKGRDLGTLKLNGDGRGWSWERWDWIEMIMLLILLFECK